MKFSMQWIRHSIQVLVFISLIIAPALSAYLFPLLFNDVFSIHWMEGKLRGNTWAAELFSFTLLDPLAALESIMAGKTHIWKTLAGATLPILLTVVFGRFFCSWICPLGFILELNTKIRTLLSRFSFSLNEITFWKGHKYIVLASGLLIAFTFSFPLFPYIYLPAALARDINQTMYGLYEILAFEHGPVFIAGLSWSMLLIFALLIIEIFLSKRLWCRSFCPGGALYSLIGWKRVLRISSPDDQCTNCGDCIKVCPMGLNPMLDQTGVACDNCFSCKSVCPTSALHYELGRIKKEQGK